MKKFWNWKNQTEATERTLFLNGTIAEESWFDDDVTPQLFKDELNSGSGDITVWINSPGGDCVAAAQIYNMLMDYKGNVTVKIDGIAASAASVIAMAGTKVLMSPVSMLMIHNPMTAAFGNSDEMQKAIEMLGSVKDSIINAYEIKTGLSRTKLSHLMDAETWMDANKAVELGFADEIMQRSTETEDIAAPTVSMLYSKANVVKDIPEPMLKDACAAVLGLSEFDEAVFSEQVERIVIPAPNEMDFYFKDGRIVPRHWESTMRKDCWTDERRAAKGRYVQAHQLGFNTSCFTSRIRCDSCGENYRRQRSRHKDGSYDSVWRCASSAKCDSPSIKEEALKAICADALGLSEFDEKVFRGQIACIHITAPFRLALHFFDGRTVEAEWQNKRNMPKHTEERKQHMREVMIQKWRERHGESNNDTGNDNPVHSDTN